MTQNEKEMLTRAEIRFLGQYVRELHLGKGPANEQLDQRGIFMDPTPGCLLTGIS